MVRMFDVAERSRAEVNYELVINENTADAPGLAIPDEFRKRAKISR